MGNTQHCELSVPFLIYASSLAYIHILPQNVIIINRQFLRNNCSEQNNMSKHDIKEKNTFKNN